MICNKGFNTPATLIHVVDNLDKANNLHDFGVLFMSYSTHENCIERIVSDSVVWITSRIFSALIKERLHAPYVDVKGQ